MNSKEGKIIALLALAELPPMQGLIKILGELDANEINSTLYFAIGQQLGKQECEQAEM